MPEAQPLALLRADIDRKPKKLRRVLTDPQMRKHIFGGIANDERKAIKEFARQNSENALKTKPKVRVILSNHPERLWSIKHGDEGSMRFAARRSAIRWALCTKYFSGSIRERESPVSLERHR